MTSFPVPPIYIDANGFSDPFLHMARANKTYGFTIAVKELKETVPNLFRYASAFKRTNNITSKGLWEMFLEKPEKPKEQTKKEKLPEEVLKLDPNSGKLPDVDPESMEDEKYNMCHFWSNFEIARLDFFRSKAYEDFFQMMDKSGGFWTERVSIRRSESWIFCRLVLIVRAVGRCSDPFSCSRCPSWPGRHSLFPRFWLPAHNHSTLPRQCSCSTTTQAEIH